MHLTQGKRLHGECCPESSFDLFWEVMVSKREFQALSAKPCQLFCNPLYIRIVSVIKDKFPFLLKKEGIY
jgi:hypothetical protein